MTGGAADPKAAPALTDWERLGGDRGVSAILNEFIDVVARDIMIGYLFRGVDLTRLKALEFGFASSHLGGTQEYTGRQLRSAHQPRRIFGGQFDRRLVLLRQVLVRHEAPPDIIERWIANNNSLRAQITYDSAGECGTPNAVDP
jgi:hemoglobin